MDDLAIARLLEQEIILSNGIEGKCGCTKFAMCPFPNTSWYYVTICKHDNDSAPRSLTPMMERKYWWFDPNNLRMVSAIAFECAFREAELGPLPPEYELAKWGREHGAVGNPELLSHIVVVRVGPRLLYIGSGGQVRQLYPEQIPRGGGWL